MINTAIASLEFEGTNKRCCRRTFSRSAAPAESKPAIVRSVFNWPARLKQVMKERKDSLNLREQNSVLPSPNGSFDHFFAGRLEPDTWDQIILSLDSESRSALMRTSSGLHHRISAGATSYSYADRCFKTTSYHPRPSSRAIRQERTVTPPMMHAETHWRIYVGKPHKGLDEYSKRYEEVREETLAMLFQIAALPEKGKIIELVFYDVELLNTTIVDHLLKDLPNLGHLGIWQCRAFQMPVVIKWDPKALKKESIRVNENKKWKREWIVRLSYTTTFTKGNTCHHNNQAGTIFCWLHEWRDRNGCPSTEHFVQYLKNPDMSREYHNSLTATGLSPDGVFAWVTEAPDTQRDARFQRLFHRATINQEFVPRSRYDGYAECLHSHKLPKVCFLSPAVTSH